MSDLEKTLNYVINLIGRIKGSLKKPCLFLKKNVKCKEMWIIGKIFGIYFINKWLILLYINKSVCLEECCSKSIVK